MIRFTITGAGKYPVSYQTPEAVFDCLDYKFGTMAAANASGWCELAAIGEEYIGDGFRIVVEEW